MIQNPSDPYVQFEAMDRALAIMVMLDKLLGKHAGLRNGKMAPLYMEAEQALSNLYQEAGRISFKS